MKKNSDPLGRIKEAKNIVIPVTLLAIIITVLTVAFILFNSVNSGHCQSNFYKINVELPNNWLCKVNNDNSTTANNPAIINIQSTNFTVTAGNVGRLFGADAEKSQIMTSEVFFKTAEFAVNVYYLDGIIVEVDAVPLANSKQEFRVIAKPKITSLKQLDSSQRDELLTIVSAFKDL